MNFINFMGCSPILYEDAPHKISVKIFEAPQFIGGESIHTIHCPLCKKSLNKGSIQLTSSNHQCPNCHQLFHLEQINWRRSAAKSSTFIQISNIFPKEAQPNSNLLTALAKKTQSPWDYFYSKSLSW